jgi:hypothetical protein
VRLLSPPPTPPGKRFGRMSVILKTAQALGCGSLVTLVLMRPAEFLFLVSLALMIAAQTLKGEPFMV